MSLRAGRMVAAGLAGLLGLGATTGAALADASVSFDCGATSTQSSVMMFVQPGESVIVDARNCIGGAYNPDYVTLNDWGWTGTGYVFSGTVRDLAPGVYASNGFTNRGDGPVYFYRDGTPGEFGYWVWFTVEAAPTQPGPSQWLQQVGRDIDQTCEISEGWFPSWASWVGDGAGGFVCSRTIAYDRGTSSWIVVGADPEHRSFVQT